MVLCGMRFILQELAYTVCEMSRCSLNEYLEEEEEVEVMEEVMEAVGVVEPIVMEEEGEGVELHLVAERVHSSLTVENTG